MRDKVDKKYTKARRFFLKAVNIFLMFAIFWIAFIICTVILSRESFVELSKMFFSADIPLMGSPILEFLLHKELIVFPLGLFILMIAKEFKIKTISTRIYFNLILLAGVMGHCAILFYYLFKPINCI